MWDLLMYISVWLECKIDMGMRRDEEKGRVVTFCSFEEPEPVSVFSVGFWGGDIKHLRRCWSSVLVQIRKKKKDCVKDF